MHLVRSVKANAVVNGCPFSLLPGPTVGRGGPDLGAQCPAPASEVPATSCSSRDHLYPSSMGDTEIPEPPLIFRAQVKSQLIFLDLQPKRIPYVPYHICCLVFLIAPWQPDISSLICQLNV